MRPGGRPIVIVELEDTLAGMDTAVAWQISRILLAFTVLVLLSSGLIGLTVRSAGHTMQRQYEQIEMGSKQLLQAAKLASVGELAGGGAQEINNRAVVIMIPALHLLAGGGADASGE